jgi:hypothetical protein
MNAHEFARAGQEKGTKARHQSKAILRHAHVCKRLGHIVDPFIKHSLPFVLPKVGQVPVFLQSSAEYVHVRV